MKNNIKGFSTVFILLILLTITVIGGVYFFVNKKSGEPENKIIGSLESQNIANRAVQEKNPDLCSQIKKGFDIGPGPSEEDLIGTCYLNMALKTTDRPTCNKIPFPARSTCIDSIAFAQNDIDYCSMTEGQWSKSSCYREFLLNGTSKKVCENINDVREKDLCYIYSVQYSKDIGVCEKLITTEHYKGQCYKGVAIEINNIKLCDKIQNQTEQRDCKSRLQ